MIGIASPQSRGSAQSVKTKLGADFPNGVDLAGATFALYDVHPTKSFGFVIDENGKIVYGYDLAYTTLGTEKQLYFAVQAERFLAGAKDPFGIDAGELPEACKGAYALLKVGQFEAAAVMAKRLAKSKDASVQGVAEKIIAAAEETEKKKFSLMEELAEAGKAGELYEELKAFLVAFPRSKLKSKAKALLSKAKSGKEGKAEATAAANFDRGLGMLGKNKKRGVMFMKVVGGKFEGTPHGDVAKELAKKLK